MGIMGKVHNIVVHIRASPNQTKEFEKLAGRLIPLGNRTRWNSWYNMPNVALETSVLNAVWNYAEEHINKGTLDKKDELSPSDVVLCRTIESFLRVFHRTTLFLEGQQATIKRVLQAMEVVQEHIQ